MGSARAVMNFSTVLKLGRVSNLPTVWSNTLAGAVLAGLQPIPWSIALLLLAMSLAYVGGMFLNDAFDHEIDAEERPERPIPSGLVTASSVFTAGYSMLAVAVLLCVITAMTTQGSLLFSLIASVLLVASIVLYNAWHKNNPISPFIMGLCRVFVYISVAYAFMHSPPATVYVGALCILCFLIGLTYTAKQESLGEVKNLWPLVFLVVPIFYGIFNLQKNVAVWLPLLLLVACVLWAVHKVRRRGAGDIPRAVVTMIAGISLVDAVLIATVAGLPLALFAIAAFFLTLLLQRYIAGT